jgi:lipid-A-disaccharide synthase
MSAALTLGMVAGEVSGDNLATPLIREIRHRHADTRFCGIGGPGMLEQGFESLYDMERLSVNGFVDPIKRLPELIGILTGLRRYFLDNRPAVFVGIDFNFFNLLLERMLRRAGIPTVHYVSPTVWAWRKGRIKSIRKSVDMMLTLYPFETEIYRQNNIDVRFVGHPLADKIPLETNVGEARQELGYAEGDRIMTILPGSRHSEVAHSAPDFFRAAKMCFQQFPDLKFLVPASGPSREKQINTIIDSLVPDLPIRILNGRAQLAMACADVVLVNSGTATLEAMLLKRPMVMSYRLGDFTYAIVSRMTENDYFALPNILAGKELVAELIQDDATPENLSRELLMRLRKPADKELLAAYTEIHLELRNNAAAKAAEAILSII